LVQVATLSTQQMRSWKLGIGIKVVAKEEHVSRLDGFNPKARDQWLWYLSSPLDGEGFEDCSLSLSPSLQSTALHLSPGHAFVL
jgi:hypothetical protein